MTRDGGRPPLQRAARLGATAATVGVGAAAARLGYATLCSRPPGGPARWARTNHRGEPVTLLEGPAAAVAVAATAVVAPGLTGRVRAACALAALGAGGFGLLDDLAERGSSKGLRGHLGALARGELTTGGVKLAGIGAVGLVAAELAAPQSPDRGRVRRAVDVAAAGALVAGSANLLNLFDLRPGRALKVSLLAAPAVATAPGAAVAAATVAGTAIGLLGEDLAERAMLGDAGANALGAVLGTALVAGARPRTRWAVLVAVLGLTLASEKVSFTKVIAATPGLRELDALGRRPAVR